MIRLEEIIWGYMTVEIRGQTYHLSKTLSSLCLRTTFRMPHEASSAKKKVEVLQKSFGPTPQPDLIYHLTYFTIYPSIYGSTWFYLIFVYLEYMSLGQINQPIPSSLSLTLVSGPKVYLNLSYLSKSRECRYGIVVGRQQQKTDNGFLHLHPSR